MRAAVARAGGIAVEDVADPVPAEGQVVVAALACGICGSDLHMLDVLGSLGPDGPALVVGHEFWPEVLDHGPGPARRFAPGTRVCAVPYATGPDGRELVGYSTRFPGGFAERLVVDAQRLVAVPDDLPTEHAALTEPLAVGVHAGSLPPPSLTGAPTGSHPLRSPPRVVAGVVTALVSTSHTWRGDGVRSIVPPC